MEGLAVLNSAWPGDLVLAGLVADLDHLRPATDGPVDAISLVNLRLLGHRRIAAFLRCKVGIALHHVE